MNSFHSKVIIFQSGFLIVVSLLTIVVANLVVSGVSTTEKRSAITRLLHPPSVEIK
jgi:hypothetical protein